MCYASDMPKTRAEKLKSAVKAVEALPQDAQDTILQEIEQRVSDFARPHMTAAQRAEVKRRLAMPRRYVPDKTIRSILRRYNPAL